jgi:V/A-type H+-transporting ATPase subunit K
MSKSKEQVQLRRRIGLSLVVLFALLAMFGVVSATKAVAQEQAPEQAARAGSAEASPTAPQMSPERAEVSKFGLIAAAVAFGFGAMGAGLAIGNVGAAAMGAVAEKPEIAGQALIFIALGEGLVIFGFITALMILGKV